MDREIRYIFHKNNIKSKINKLKVSEDAFNCYQFLKRKGYELNSINGIGEVIFYIPNLKKTYPEDIEFCNNSITYDSKIMLIEKMIIKFASTLGYNKEKSVKNIALKDSNWLKRAKHRKKYKFFIKISNYFKIKYLRLKKT